MRVMSFWELPTGTLRFSIPTREMVAHALESDYRITETSLWCDDDVSLENDLPDLNCGDDPDDIDDIDDGCYTDEGGSLVYTYTSRVWWWEQRDCTEDTCQCGPVTLLEALEQLGESERAAIVKDHADEMRNLYDHFWAGQGLITGSSQHIGDACPDCLIGGAAHVWTIYENACTLAEEFGEALAAYAYELSMGQPRHPAHGEAA